MPECDAVEMTNRIDRVFEKLRREGRAALIPFLTAGDPDMGATLELLRAAVASGADLIEIGVPFSDPTADGPALQKSYDVGLRNGASLSRVLELVAELRRESDVPVILYGYFNPLFHYGCERFAKDARQAGVDGLLVVDLPPEEADELLQWTKKEELHFVFLLSPTTDEKRARHILKLASGFVYYVSVTGVTGVRPVPLESVAAAVARMRQWTTLPIGIGFGIATPEQAATVSTFADAVIVGSAIMRLVDTHRGSPELVPAVANFIAALRQSIVVSEGKGSAVGEP